MKKRIPLLVTLTIIPIVLAWVAFAAFPTHSVSAGTISATESTVITPTLSMCMQANYTNDGNNNTLNCTSNNVDLATITASVVDGCDGTVGDTATIILTATVDTNANSIYDLGFYIPTSGSDPINGSECYIAELLPIYGDLDMDMCGDVANAGSIPNVGLGEVTVECLDSDGDGNLDINYCAAWSNSATDSCTTHEQLVPSTASMCSCPDEPVNLDNIPVPGTLTITKVVTPAGAGAGVAFPFDYVSDNNNSGSAVITGSGTTGPMTILPIGTYTITENTPYGWDLILAECVNDDVPPVIVDPTTGVDITANSNWTCTFINTPHLETITATKVVSSSAPTVPPVDFEITIECDVDGDGIYETSTTQTTQAGGVITLPDVPVGAVCRVSETDNLDDAWDPPIYEPATLTVTVEGPNVFTVTNTYVPVPLAITLNQGTTSDPRLPLVTLLIFASLILITMYVVIMRREVSEK